MKGKLSKDRRGGIEGLPLQLIIIIMVATIGAGIILGWMSNVESPKYIGGVQSHTTSIELENGVNTDVIVSITVTDQDGNPLEGATVALTGLGIKTKDGKIPYGTTDSNGDLILNRLEILMMHLPVGYITVNVSAPGYGEHNTTRIPVIA